MERLKVKTVDLIRVLKENRQKHVNEYKEAVRQYRMRAAEALRRELDKCTSGKKFETNMGMTRPMSHEKEYDLVIKMLEMSVEDVTILDHHEFNQFVMDEWSWMPSFRSSTTYYGQSGSCGTSGCSSSSGTSGTSGIKYVDETKDDPIEEYITIKFSEDELYDQSETKIAGSTGVSDNCHT